MGRKPVNDSGDYSLLTDLTVHLSDFNLWLQGEISLICDLYSRVKEFSQLQG